MLAVTYYSFSPNIFFHSWSVACSPIFQALQLEEVKFFRLPSKSIRNEVVTP